MSSAHRIAATLASHLGIPNDRHTMCRLRRRLAMSFGWLTQNCIINDRRKHLLCEIKQAAGTNSPKICRFLGSGEGDDRCVARLGG